MMTIGIDDTDIIDSPGTNQLAKQIVRHAADRWTCRRIVRHQLLSDSRIPYTSQNGSASIVFEPRAAAPLAELIELCRQNLRDWYVEGSDPGLCAAEHVPEQVIDFGRLCQREIVSQDRARELAAQLGIHLEGLGGTEGGVIGALAAMGLSQSGNDGRIVQWQTWPDDLSGPQPVATVRSRDVVVCEADSGEDVLGGTVDVGKHLRPNLRGGRAVLYVQRDPAASENDCYTAIRRT